MKWKMSLIEWLVVILIIVLLASIFLMEEIAAPILVVGYLLGGWVGFLWRNQGGIRWRWEVVWSVVIYAALLIVGGHYFARWLYSEMKHQRWRWGWTLRIFVLFILMFAAGTSAVAIVHQTTWIVTEPEPMFARVGGSRERANRVKCASNLRQIGECIEVYTQGHAGKYPDDLQQLIIDADLNPEVLVCPSSNHERAIGATTQEIVANAHHDLNYSCLYLGKGLAKPVEPLLVIAYERAGNQNDGMNVLFVDGHAEWFATRDMRKLLAQIEAAGGKPILFDNR